MLSRRFEHGRGLRALPAVERLEAVVTVVQVMGQLDHLEPEPARTEASCGQYDERLRYYSPTCSVQTAAVDHQHLGERLPTVEYWPIPYLALEVKFEAAGTARGTT
jgi:hypothetical protein